ncbi:hypothetical protein ES288_D02G150800v1 [Gossypium darwinii]|uniref:Uncharacterized protein n=1 Tax=Gossypium darwinii TaxID=34276 RepID=A0A5D2DGV1_GOSDA|nr:hypothetical protein ES288_D02G150800v1 [Gossypium darwinii]
MLKFEMLPPLDAPHHLRKLEWAPYREGVTLEEKHTSSVGTVVDVGLDKNVVVDQALGPRKRVTVAMGTNQNLDYGNKIVLILFHVSLSCNCFSELFF